MNGRRYQIEYGETAWQTWTDFLLPIAIKSFERSGGWKVGCRECWCRASATNGGVPNLVWCGRWYYNRSTHRSSQRDLWL